MAYKDCPCFSCKGFMCKDKCKKFNVWKRKQQELRKQNKNGVRDGVRG